MKSYEERLKTFETWPINNNVSAIDLAKNGFYYLQKGDEVKCAFCNVEIMNWQHGDVVSADHKIFSPKCKMVTSELEDEEEYEEGVDTCGPSINIWPNPKHPIYSSKFVRLESYFEKWPKSLKQTPDQLSDAGFFYSGTGDGVICFYNGCSLKDWTENDDPWKEHAYWFENCPYVLLKKGKEFVQMVISEFKCMQIDEKQQEEENTNTENENKELCKICYEQIRNICLLPCGHVIICLDCSLNLVKCPICRTMIEEKKKIFFS
jgi:baculoviral IAP repeat-containing protein 7/8